VGGELIGEKAAVAAACGRIRSRGGVSEQGTRLQTVGDHWKLSRPLDNTERGYLDRRGLCLGSHQEIPPEACAVPAAWTIT